jgi:hypothetical protein
LSFLPGHLFPILQQAKPAQSQDRAGTTAIQYTVKWRSGSSQRQIFRANFASHLVGLDFEGDLLAFSKAGKTRPFNGADVNEHIVSATTGLDKAKTLLAIEPLDSTCRHFLLQSMFA